MLSHKVSPQLENAAIQAVFGVTTAVKGALAGVVSTEDGFEVASRSEGAVQVARLSALSSSLAALGSVALAESELGTCSNVVLEADGGVIVLTQARRSDVNLVLSIVAGRETTLGQVLYYCRIAARRLERA